MGKDEKMIIYQVFTRLFGNNHNHCINNGNITENGCGKMADFTAKALNEIKKLGATHIWYTGIIEHATQTDYRRYNIRPDHPAIVKGKAGSPYAIKDYYDVDPDLANDVQERMKEFENLVQRTHRSGLKVIIDFVPNHVARQYHSDAQPDGTSQLGANDDPNYAFSPYNNFYYIPQSELHGQFDMKGSAAEPYRECPAKATGNNRFDAYPNITDWYETVKLNYGVDYQNGGTCHFNPTPDTWTKMLDILLFWADKNIDGFRCDMAEMVPVEFWEWVIPQVKEKHPDLLFIAEVYNPAEYQNYIFRGKFDYLYDKVGLYDTLRNVICGYDSATAITRSWQSLGGIEKRMLNFLENHDEQRIASAIAASGSSLTGQILSTKKDQVSLIGDTLATLDDDFYATARNALVVNATAVSRTVMDQARGMGEGRSAEVDNGRARIWAAGIGHWGEADGNSDTMDVDFRAGFLGAEALVLDNTKFGAFFGYGTTDYKSGANKIDGDDTHFGVYGLTDIGNVTMTYGVAYTDQDRDTTRVWGGTVNQHSENASVLQGFVEGAYNFDLSVAKVSPYLGFTWARVETDAVVDNAIGHSFKTDEIKDDIQIATLGVRTAVPFAMGNMPVALTADLGWSHYFGDTEGLVNVQMGEGGKFAAIEGSELKDQANLGLGIVGQVAKHATVGVSYSGSWGSDINTHGIFANVRFNF